MNNSVMQIPTLLTKTTKTTDSESNGLEYCLETAKFNPTKNKDNKFLSVLEKRFSLYYSKQL